MKQILEENRKPAPYYCNTGPKLNITNTSYCGVPFLSILSLYIHYNTIESKVKGVEYCSHEGSYIIYSDAIRCVVGSTNSCCGKWCSQPTRRCIILGSLFTKRRWTKYCANELTGSSSNGSGTSSCSCSSTCTSSGTGTSFRNNQRTNCNTNGGND